MSEERLTIGDIGEFCCISHITKNLLYRPEFVKVGVGDDGAVYTVPKAYDSVISTDTMVEGIHFTTETMDAFSVGFRFAAATISDMAAMGADPIAFVVAVALPGRLSLSWLTACYDGIRTCSKQYGTNILGGDTTGSPRGVILTGTVVGILPTDTAILRSGAQVGDIVFVTGTPGDASAGLSVILAQKEEDYPSLVEKHRRPRPQVESGRLLREMGATSLTDISDGISREIREIVTASHVSVILDIGKLPISEEAKRWGEEGHISPLTWSLDGGEDYELIGTMKKDDFQKVKEKIPITEVGRIVSGDGHVIVEQDGIKKELTVGAYDHFK